MRKAVHREASPLKVLYKKCIFSMLSVAFIVDEIFNKNFRVNCKLFIAWTESPGNWILKLWKDDKIAVKKSIKKHILVWICIGKYHGLYTN